MQQGDQGLRRAGIPAFRQQAGAECAHAGGTGFQAGKERGGGRRVLTGDERLRRLLGGVVFS